VDGSLGGSGRSRNINPIGMTKGSKGIEPEPFWRRLQEKHSAMETSEARFESEHCSDADLVVVAFGTLARFARYVIRELRREGVRVGYFRPITLWPYPAEALARAARGARRVAVLEQNAGQMIDDVRLAILGQLPVAAIGGISSDQAGFGVGPIFDTEEIRARIRRGLEGREVHP
jgi:2-oxoglutarate ferredoxin oxidoreductase subunit alpha